MAFAVPGLHLPHLGGDRLSPARPPLPAQGPSQCPGLRVNWPGANHPRESLSPPEVGLSPGLGRSAGCKYLRVAQEASDPNHGHETGES